MLHWRLSIGTFLVASLAGICWLDVHSKRPGLYWLAPLVFLIVVLATDELLAMFRRVRIEPLPWVVHLASMAAAGSAFLSLTRDDASGANLSYLAGGFFLGLLIVVVGEMWRYGTGGNSLLNLTSGAFAVLYLGSGLGYMIELRQVAIQGDMARGGMFALLSMLAVVKCTDIGAYFTGRLCGKHKMAPALSPGKTWEGVAGGVLTAVVVSVLMLGPVARACGFSSTREGWNWLAGALLYGLLVSLAGITGDLLESLLKREAGIKDSSTWLPGFGGVLDIVDSPLLAAPVAYFLWASGVLLS